MIKKNLKLLIITSIITILPIIGGLILWDKLPAEIPIHWDINGEVDGTSSKAFAVFGMPLFLLAIQFALAFAISADPKRSNHSEKMHLFSFWITPVLSNIVALFSYASALGMDLVINMIVPIMLGLPLTIIGNYLPKCRQNYTIGIKLPWTLHSEKNWNKTHRLAGWIWLGGGLLMTVIGFFGIIWHIFPIILAITLVPVIYSYVLHRKGA